MDILYTIRVYQPFFYKYSKRNYYKHCKYSHEIVALGSNTLTDVRDKILCKSDIGICQETDVPSVNVDTPSNTRATVSIGYYMQTSSNNILLFYRKFILQILYLLKILFITTFVIRKQLITQKWYYNGQ